MSFGENLKRVRTEKGMSQAALAEKTGLNQSSIAYFERGARQPLLATAQALAEALDCELAELTK